MRLIRGKLDKGRIFIKVGIRPFQLSEPVGGYSSAVEINYSEFSALVDTGARRTCLSETAVQRLKLKHTGKVDVWNVKRPEEHFTYLFHVGIWPDADENQPSPVYGIGDEIEGIDVGDHRYFDVLLGMDIISRGYLHLEQDGSFEMGFP
jgi:hypothetical protein